MNHRIAFGLGTVTLALLITGLALGGDSTTGGFESRLGSSVAASVESTTFPTSFLSVPPGGVAIPEGSSLAFEIGHAGTVIVGRLEDVLNIVSVQPTQGWISEIQDASGRLVGGMLRNAYIGVTYSFALNDGVTRFHIESVAQDIITAAKTSLATANGKDAASSTNETSPRLATTAVPRSSTTSTTAQAATTTTESDAAPEGASTITTSVMVTTTLPPPTTVPTFTTTTTTPTTTTTVDPTTTTTIDPTTTTTTTEVEVWNQIVIPSPGGSIVVSYRPGEVRLDAASPAPTFLLEDVDEDLKRVQVEFEGDDVTYTLEAKWERGEFVTDVDASGPGAD